MEEEDDENVCFGWILRREIWSYETSEKKRTQYISRHFVRWKRRFCKLKGFTFYMGKSEQYSSWTSYPLKYLNITLLRKVCFTSNFG